MHGINFCFFKIDLATLAANPSGNSVENKVIAVPINVKRSSASLHRSLTVAAFHRFTLVLESADHSFSSGRYAVMIARKSGFGEQTT